MAADGSTTIRANRLPAETLFTTEHPFDAELAGYDGPTPPDEGGFRVVFDGSHGYPSVTLNGSDGEITVCGLSAIKQLADALLGAERAARRMSV